MADDFFNKSYKFELCLRIIDSIDRLKNTTKAVELYEKMDIANLRNLYETFENIERIIYER